MKKVDVAKKIGTPSALTQDQGDIIYQLICDSIEKNEPITLDFDSIESMISPFLNNSIGKLYGKYSSEEISSLLTVKNFPDSKKATLNMVIQNAKKFYSNQASFNASVEEAINS